MKFTKQTLLSALAIAAVAMASALPGNAATFATNSTMDAFVTTGPTGNLVSSNYGGAGALTLANQSASNPQGTFQSVLQFNVAGAMTAFNSQYGAGQWTIQSVTLQLFSASANNGIFNQTSTAGQFGISFMQNNSWTEGSGSPGSPGNTGIMYGTLPNFIGAGDENLGSFGYNGATSGLSSYNLTLTSAFLTDLDGGGIVSLRTFAEDNSINYIFNSKNFGTAADRPLLTITAVPEPAMGALWLCGLGAFAIARKRAGSGKRQ